MSARRELRSPLAAVDVIIETRPDHIVLVKRNDPPYGWGLPGGFVDYGEGLWQAAVREVQDETTLSVRLLEQLYTYSDPRRDNRCHTITTVFLAKAEGEIPETDADMEIREFPCNDLPPLVFDHEDIVRDYLRWKTSGERPGAVRKCTASIESASPGSRHEAGEELGHR